MPHDINGNILKEGDEVILRCRVKSVQAGEEFCNVTIESIYGRKPDGYHETWAGNTAVLERVPAEPATTVSEKEAVTA